jgi:hypothetical protein
MKDSEGEMEPFEIPILFDPILLPKLDGVLWCLGSNHRPLDGLHYEGIARQNLFTQKSQKWKVK